MKRLKNSQKTICGVKYKLFAIIRNQKTLKYCYYISTPWSDYEVGNVMIWKNKKKNAVLNKYTLSLLAILYTLIKCTVYYPSFVVIMFVYMYLDGGRNFVRDGMWAQNERFFNYCNIIIIIILIVALTVS